MLQMGGCTDGQPCSKCESTGKETSDLRLKTANLELENKQKDDANNAEHKHIEEFITSRIKVQEKRINYAISEINNTNIRLNDIDSKINNLPADDLSWKQIRDDLTWKTDITTLKESTNKSLVELNSKFVCCVLS